MRGIFVESLRGAIVRLLRTFIMIVIILLIVFIIGLFHQEKVHALVYRETVGASNTIVEGSASGSVPDNQRKTIKWDLDTNFLVNNDFDLLVFKFGVYDFHGTIDNGTYCSAFSQINTGGAIRYECSSYRGQEGVSLGTMSSFTVYPSLVYKDTNITVPCTFNSELQDLIVCPVSKTSKGPLQFIMEIENNNMYSLNYNLTLNYYKYYYNHESTEVVKGLQGVTIQQQNTTQAIEDLTTQQEQAQQYIENNNVTGSQTQFQGGVSDLSQQINAQISGVNDLTQIVLLPVTLFMDLSTGTCTPLHLVVPFTNNELDLPCMKPIYEEHFGGLLTIFSTIVCAVTTYWVSVNSAKLIKEILDCDNDRIEVIDL